MYASTDASVNRIFSSHRSAFPTAWIHTRNVLQVRYSPLRHRAGYLVVHYCAVIYSIAARGRSVVRLSVQYT